MCVLASYDTARYLGLHYGPGQQLAACTKQLIAAGRRAAFGLTSRCRDKRKTVPTLCMLLYNSRAVPVLSYKAAIWGPDFINVNFEVAMVNPVVQE